MIERWDDAVAHLGADPVLARLMAQYRGERLVPRGDAFHTLARAVVGQQISVKAAQTVWDRLTATLGAVTPKAVCAADETRLRGAGLSRQKASYLLGLAEAAPALATADWDALDDEATIARLCELRGVGRWTAEMFMIFYLLRPDVLPLSDIGLVNAIRLHYGAALERDAMLTLAERWRPWRSVATWYLWRSLDPEPVEY